MNHRLFWICFLVSVDLTICREITTPASGAEVYINGNCAYANGIVYENGNSRPENDDDRVLIENYKIQFALYVMEHQRYLNLLEEMATSIPPSPTIPQVAVVLEGPSGMLPSQPDNMGPQPPPFQPANFQGSQRGQVAKEPAQENLASPTESGFTLAIIFGLTTPAPQHEELQFSETTISTIPPFPDYGGYQIQPPHPPQQPCFCALVSCLYMFSR